MCAHYSACMEKSWLGQQGKETVAVSQVVRRLSENDGSSQSGEETGELYQPASQKDWKGSRSSL